MLPPAIIAHAIIVHGAQDALAALDAARGLRRRLVLLSAPGAGCYGGSWWWRGLVDQALLAGPGLVAADILDCGDQAGRAVDALRAGCRTVVLDPANRAFADVAGRARSVGATLLALPPPALDLSLPGALRRLPAWLDAGRLDGTGGAW